MNKIYNLFYGFIEFVLLKTFPFIKIIKFYIYIYAKYLYLVLKSFMPADRQSSARYNDH